MTYFWIIFGLLFFLLHSSYTLYFTVKILKYSRRSIAFTMLFSIANTCVFSIAYFLGCSYFVLYLIYYFLYFLEFRVLSKTCLRQIWFAVSSFLVNIVTVHLLVFVLASQILDSTVNDIFYNHTLFFQTLGVSHLFLFLMLLIIEMMIPEKKLKQVSITKIYSQIMSVFSTFLFLFVYVDTWFVFKMDTYDSYIISIIGSIAFVFVMYYCMFFFNAHLTGLHEYRRKVDEIKIVHEKVMAKKSIAEFKLYRDDLTKLYNRRFIDHKINELCERMDIDFGLIYADLAALKQVNDTLGHKTGDRYIIKVANIIKTTLREEDFSARIGGDEFLIVLIDISADELTKVVKRIQKNIEVQSAKESYTIYANLGYEHFGKRKGQKSKTEILKRVENLMKMEKESFYKEGGK